MATESTSAGSFGSSLVSLLSKGIDTAGQYAAARLANQNAPAAAQAAAPAPAPAPVAEPARTAAPAASSLPKWLPWAAAGAAILTLIGALVLRRR